MKPNVLLDLLQVYTQENHTFILRHDTSLSLYVQSYRAPFFSFKARGIQWQQRDLPFGTFTCGIVERYKYSVQLTLFP